MLSRQENELLTTTGPGTGCGALLRSYWQPVALVEELPEVRPAKPVRLLGEDLVLWRNPDGAYGLIGRSCAHRGVDLAYGRLEDGGLRCLYHGWLYDRGGRCLEQPAEPEGSRFHEKIQHTSYPCQERNGIVFAYLGGGPPPPFPDYDAFVAPEAHTFAFKGLWECNWLQGLEGGIDPSHVSFLHRFLQEDPRDSYGQQFREVVEGTDTTLSRLVGERFRPDIDVEATDYGLRVFALRDLDEQTRHVRITNLAFPNAFVIPFGNHMTITQWHVPIDDVTHFWYMIMCDFAQPTDKATLRAQRLQSCTLPDYRPVRNRTNDWGFDPQEQQSLTYTGMGLDINVHDQWAVESIGPVQDRSVERLGVSDYRRMLLRAIEDHAAGKVTPGQATDEPTARTLRGPAAVDLVAPREGWQQRWRDHDLKRRQRSPWADAQPVAG
jgi:phenylpropionate dioxygenase-like ring-hydroxylating dioxygenase large terminal subunit